MRIAHSKIEVINRVTEVKYVNLVSTQVLQIQTNNRFGRVVKLLIMALDLKFYVQYYGHLTFSSFKKSFFTLYLKFTRKRIVVLFFGFLRASCKRCRLYF